MNNYRPLQERNDRKILASFIPVEETRYTGPAVAIIVIALAGIFVFKR